LSEKILLI